MYICVCLPCPSNKRLKFAETVLFLLRSRTVDMAKRVCRDCPIPNCGAKYLVKLSNHLTDVHGLDYVNRRKWLDLNTVFHNRDQAKCPLNRGCPLNWGSA